MRGESSGSGARDDRLRTQEPCGTRGLRFDQVEADAAGQGRRVAPEQRRRGLDGGDFLDEVIEDPGAGAVRAGTSAASFRIARDNPSLGPSLGFPSGFPSGLPSLRAVRRGLRRQQLDVVGNPPASNVPG